MPRRPALRGRVISRRAARMRKAREILIRILYCYLQAIPSNGIRMVAKEGAARGFRCDRLLEKISISRMHPRGMDILLLLFIRL